MPHGLDSRIGRSRQGDEDDRDMGVDGTDFLQDLQAGLVGKPQVKKHYVWRLRRDAVEPLPPRMRDLYPVPRSREDVANNSRKQFWVVINEKQMGHDGIAVDVP